MPTRDVTRPFGDGAIHEGQMRIVQTNEYIRNVPLFNPSKLNILFTSTKQNITENILVDFHLMDDLGAGMSYVLVDPTSSRAYY